MARIVESVSRSVVAVNARRHLSSSGVYWCGGIVVTAAHTIRRAEEISVMSPVGQTLAASVAGADPSTDIAVLKIESKDSSVPEFGNTGKLRAGHFVVAVGRGAQRGLNATLRMIGVLSGGWRTWRGGLLDQFIGLDLTLLPAAAGGPLVDTQGRCPQDSNYRRG